MEIEPVNWQRVVDVNLTGVLYLSQAVIPHMRARKQGSIACMSSVSAQRGGGIFGGPHYSAAKAGVLGLAKAMARELGPDGIRVNCVTPGLIQTDITGDKLTPAMKADIIKGIPLNRLGEAKDVANIYLFLASDLSAYVTGAVIDANGGADQQRLDSRRHSVPVDEETLNDLPFELFVAVRYLLARRKQAFISLISLISAVGVAVGVMALLIVLALMTGLQGELRDRIVGSAAHVYVLKDGGLGEADEEVRKVRAVPRVVAAAPVVLGLGLAKSAGGSQFVTIKGVDPTLEPGVTNVGRSMLSGSLDALTPVQGSMSGIMLGKDLAQKLGVSLGDGVEVLTPEGTLTPFGVSPRQRAFKVVGVFGLGLFEYDSSYGFVHLSVAEKVFDRTHADLIEVKVDDLFAAQEVAEGIQAGARTGLRGAGLGRHEQVAVLGAVAGEDGDVDHDRLDRDGRGAQHYRVAGAAGHGEDARHRDPEDDGQFGREHPADLHVAGAGHRDRRHDTWRRRRLRADLPARSLPVDQRTPRRLSDFARAIPAAAARLRRGRRVGDPRLFRGHHLPVATGGEARSGAGAAVSMRLPASRFRFPPALRARGRADRFCRLAAGSWRLEAGSYAVHHRHRTLEELRRRRPPR